jgi:acyl-ACP thioesterase
LYKREKTTEAAERGKKMGEHKRVVADLTVRFRDIDAMGHVNNAVFFTFFEEGRSAFLRRVLLCMKCPSPRA